MTPENKQALEFLRSWKDEVIIAPGSAGYLRTDEMCIRDRIIPIPTGTPFPSCATPI